jgi:hypothetical protein
MTTRKNQKQIEALNRAVNPVGGTMNYGLIISGFQVDAFKRRMAGIQKLQKH